MVGKSKFVSGRRLRVKLNQKERERRHTNLLCSAFLIVSIAMSVFILLESHYPFSGQITSFAVLSGDLNGVSDATPDENLDPILGTATDLVDVSVTDANGLLPSAGANSVETPPEGVEFIRKDAEMAISDAETAISEMKIYSLPTKFVEDQLALAKKYLIYADYANTIKLNENPSKVQEAKEILKQFESQDFKYSDVLEYTNNIKSHAESGIRLIDAYAVVEAKKSRYSSIVESSSGGAPEFNSGLLNAFSVFGLDLNGYSEQGIDTSKSDSLVKESRIAFQEDRYNQAQILLSQANSELDKAKAEYTVAKAISEGGRGFIRKNWLQFLIVVSVLTLVIVFAGMQYKSFSMKNNLEVLKTEKKTLTDLMKKTQKEHFIDKNLPLSIYKIRMERYNTRQREIESQIPVLDAAINKKKVKGVLKKPDHKFKLKIK